MACRSTVRPTSSLFASPIQTFVPPNAGSKVTLPPTLVNGDVIESVFASAVVDRSVHVDTPAAFVTEHGPIVLFDPVAENVGVVPTAGLLFESLSVIVIVEASMPSATAGVVPWMVEFAATGAARTNSSVFDT